jgi:hypothetical protein
MNDVKPNNIVFKTNTNDIHTEVLRISPEGFYVRGVKVEQGPEEAVAVYNAVKQMIMWDTLRR